MKILFISDVISWNQFLTVFNDAEPDLVMMGGDLVSDGSAAFWSELDSVIMKLPELSSRVLDFLESNKDQLLVQDRFRAVERQLWLYKKIMECIKTGYGGAIETDFIFAGSPLLLTDMLTHVNSDLEMKFHELWINLRYAARKSQDFLKLAMDTHFSKFYEALDHCGNNCEQVFVVMGDHDYHDFQGVYDFERINSIRNAKEVSGKREEFGDLRIVGLGYVETHYLRRLRPLIALNRDKTDIVLTHAETRRLPLISQIQPQLIMRGHFETGSYTINNIPAVSTVFPVCYSTAEFNRGMIEEVSSWFYCQRVSRKWEKCEKSCDERRVRRAKNLAEDNTYWPWFGASLGECPLRYFESPPRHPVSSPQPRTSAPSRSASASRHRASAPKHRDSAIMLLTSILSQKEKSLVRAEIDNDPMFASKYDGSIGVAVRNTLRACGFRYGYERMRRNWFGLLAEAACLPKEKIVLTEPDRRTLCEYKREIERSHIHEPQRFLLGLKSVTDLLKRPAQ